MPPLNEELVFHRDAPPGVRTAFVGQIARRCLHPAGTRLFKFTEFGFYPIRQDGTGQAGSPISPWWCSVDPVPGTDDRGLDGLIAAAQAAGVPTAAYAREVLAVMFGWNALAVPQLGMARVLRITLTTAAYGFHGRCQRMPHDRPPPIGAGPAKPSLPGGGYQIWLPNLTAAHFTATGVNLIP